MSGCAASRWSDSDYHVTMVTWKNRNRFLSRRGLWYSLALCLAILVLGGVGFQFLEPQTPTLHEAMWLAFTTAATVGYGDLVPTTLASRAFAVLVVILGLAVLSLVTASLAAIFVETEERQIERDLMHEIGALRADVRSLRAELKAALPRTEPAEPRNAQPAKPGQGRIDTM